MIDRETQIMVLLVFTVVPLMFAVGIIASMVSDYRERKRVQRILSGEYREDCER